jgi:hypothetical protein
MEYSHGEIIANIDSLWKSAIEIESEDDDHLYFNKLRLNREYTNKLETVLKSRFQNYKNENIYDTNLRLIELCTDYPVNSKQTKALFLAQVFQTWLTNFLKKNKVACRVVPYEASCYQYQSEGCVCCLEESLVIQAFDTSTRHHMCLFSVFNKIYRFTENCHLVQMLAIDRLNMLTRDLNYIDQANLLGELQLQNYIDTKQVVNDFE